MREQFPERWSEEVVDDYVSDENFYFYFMLCTGSEMHAAINGSVNFSLPFKSFCEIVVLEMSTALRSAKYWARKAIRNSCGKQVLLHGEKRFAREELRKQESHPKRMAAFAKAKRAASCRTRFQKFGRKLCSGRDL